jgi:hypothetical protein
MEQLCYFVNSRGILKSCNIRSPNPKSSNRDDIKYLINMIKYKKMFNGMSIYVCSELLKFFVKVILPKIDKSFVLVSGDSDLCVPLEALKPQETYALLNSPYLIKWFTQNTRIQDNDKIVQIPIGLDYHTISNNPNCSWKMPGENHLPKFQEKILVSIKNRSIPFFIRKPKIYVNFSTNSDRFNQRKNALETIPNNLLVIETNSNPRSYFWNQLINYAFVLSPFGIGMDCHRTWEALCFGSIPIICAPHFEKLFEDLPVLIVKNWNEITQDLLDQTIENFKNKTFNYQKLTLEYWRKRISSGV